MEYIFDFDLVELCHDSAVLAVCLETVGSQLSLLDQLEVPRTVFVNYVEQSATHTKMYPTIVSMART